MTPRRGGIVTFATAWLAALPALSTVCGSGPANPRAARVRATRAVRYATSSGLRGAARFRRSGVRPAAAAALGLLGAALLLAGCNSPGPGGAPTVTPAPSAVASPSPSAAPALAPPPPTPTAVAPPTPAATPVASPSPTTSGAPPAAAPTPAGDGDEQRATVADPKASQSLARGAVPDPDTGGREPGGGTPLQSKDEARAEVTRGPAYTWQDGDRTQRVFLATDLIVQDNADTRDDDEIVARGNSESIVRKQPRHEGSTTAEPVFHSQGGDLMTLPGGVIVVFDEDWDRARADQFFADHDVALSRVEAREYLPNAFFVTTEPGFPSLDLANALGGGEGVVISSPNWRTEVTTR